MTAQGFEERLAELTAEPVPETDDLRNLTFRRRITRRLLADPVLYYDELDEDERAYLISQRHAITRRIEEATGLIPEMRAEGIAMVDPDDQLTDVRMPEQRTDGHVTLLVAEYLARREQATLGELHAFVRQAAAEHAGYWRKGVTEPGAETELLDIGAGEAVGTPAGRGARLGGPQPGGHRAVCPGASPPSARRARGAPMLPMPSSERWKPLRAGLVDMFYYDAEEFWFHDGRLLLRGNNGTGKSKVLALTLPFLLDGELAPHRVEPDGDRQKKMEWNLLLGGKHPNPERLGYTWLEFGRRAADGTTEFRTIGCGLKAVAGRGIARHWFFVTTQRVGEHLHLLPASRVPLTREKLRDEIDGHGLVYDRATDYRRAVDEALFGLGEHRYEALINLLIQLRQPQLSKKPDEKLLSRALTEALPPLSPGLVTTVAESFRGLDEERDALRALQEARQAATDFLGYYGRYAKIAAKRRATGPRQAQSRYEQFGRDLTAAEEAFTAAQQELDGAQRELTALGEQQKELEARQKALEADPAMRDAERLEQLRQDAGRKEKAARDREADRDRQAGQVQKHTDKARQAARRADAGWEKLAQALREAAATATDARCAQQHRAAVAALGRHRPGCHPACRTGRRRPPYGRCLP